MKTKKILNYFHFHLLGFLLSQMFVLGLKKHGSKLTQTLKNFINKELDLVVLDFYGSSSRFNIKKTDSFCAIEIK